MMNEDLPKIIDQIHLLDKKVDLLAAEFVPMKSQIVTMNETLAEIKTANAEKAGVAKFKKSFISGCVTILTVLAAFEIHNLIPKNLHF